MSDEGWQPTDAAGEPIEELELDDLDMLGELTHPTRSRLVRALKQPRSVAELAPMLDVPVTRLYHHVNRLEQLGFIHVVATRRVAAVVERRYQVVARSFSVAGELFRSTEPREISIALGSLFDLAKLQFQREVESGRWLPDDAKRKGSIVSLGEAKLTPARRTELVSKLHALVDEYVTSSSDDEPDAEQLAVFIAAFPVTP